MDLESIDEMRSKYINKEFIVQVQKILLGETGRIFDSDLVVARSLVVLRWITDTPYAQLTRDVLMVEVAHSILAYYKQEFLDLSTHNTKLTNDHFNLSRHPYLGYDAKSIKLKRLHPPIYDFRYI